MLYRTRSLLIKTQLIIKTISTFPYLNQKPKLVNPTPTSFSLPSNSTSGSPLYNENWQNLIPKTSYLLATLCALHSLTYDFHKLLKEMFEAWVRSLDKNGKPNKPDANLFNHYLRANIIIGAYVSDLLGLLA